MRGFTKDELAEIKLSDQYESGKMRSVYSRQIYELYFSDHEAREITELHKESFEPYELAKHLRRNIEGNDGFNGKFYVVSIGKKRAIVAKEPEFYEKQRREGTSGEFNDKFLGLTSADIKQMQKVQRSTLLSCIMH